MPRLWVSILVPEGLERARVYGSERPQAGVPPAELRTLRRLLHVYVYDRDSLRKRGGFGVGLRRLGRSLERSRA